MDIEKKKAMDSNYTNLFNMGYYFILSILIAKLLYLIMTWVSDGFQTIHPNLRIGKCYLIRQSHGEFY